MAFAPQDIQLLPLSPISSGVLRSGPVISSRAWRMRLLVWIVSPGGGGPTLHTCGGVPIPHTSARSPISPLWTWGVSALGWGVLWVLALATVVAVGVWPVHVLRAVGACPPSTACQGGEMDGG